MTVGMILPCAIFKTAKCLKRIGLWAWQCDTNHTIFPGSPLSYEYEAVIHDLIVKQTFLERMQIPTNVSYCGQICDCIRHALSLAFQTGARKANTIALTLDIECDVPTNGQNVKSHVSKILDQLHMAQQSSQIGLENFMIRCNLVGDAANKPAPQYWTNEIQSIDQERFRLDIL